jgi:hypothetical protein
LAYRSSIGHGGEERVTFKIPANINATRAYIYRAKKPEKMGT